MKEQEGKIGYKEGLALGFTLLGAKTLVPYPTFLVAVGATAAWQVGLVSTAAALAIFWPTAKLMQRFPGAGLGEIADEVAGGVGALLALGVAVYFSLLGVLLTRNIAEGYIVSILPETPPSVLVFGLVACAAAASYRGIEPLGRTALIFLPLAILAAAGLVLLNWNHFHWPWIFPFWGYGLQTTIREGLIQSGANGEILTLLACGYAFRAPDITIRAGRNAILAAGLAISTFTLAFLIVFGYPAAVDIPFPSFLMAQSIYLGRFFQRVESIFVLVGFFTGVVTLSMLFHAAVSLITQVLRLPFHRPLAFPMAVLWFAGAMVPPDFRTVMEILGSVRSPAGLLAFGLPLLLLVLAKFRGKGRGESHVA